MAERTFTQAEVNALLAKSTGASDLDVIESRPYHTIVHPGDGQLLCTPPGIGGGPTSINGLHPDDYYKVVTDDKGNVKLDDKGNATAGGA